MRAGALHACFAIGSLGIACYDASAVEMPGFLEGVSRTSAVEPDPDPAPRGLAALAGPERGWRRENASSWSIERVQTSENVTQIVNVPPRRMVMPDRSQMNSLQQNRDLTRNRADNLIDESQRRARSGSRSLCGSC